jgi:hypothetical protein
MAGSARERLHLIWLLQEGTVVLLHKDGCILALGMHCLPSTARVGQTGQCKCLSACKSNSSTQAARHAVTPFPCMLVSINARSCPVASGARAADRSHET